LTTLKKVKLKISRRAAIYVRPDASRQLQMAAAGAAVPLAIDELIPVLYYLYKKGDADTRRTVVHSLREMPLTILRPFLESSQTPSVLLDFLARVCGGNIEILDMVLRHEQTEESTLIYLARHVDKEGILRFAEQDQCLFNYPEVAEIILSSKLLPDHYRLRFGGVQTTPPDNSEEPSQTETGFVLVDDPVENDAVEADVESDNVPAEKMNKYQQALTLGVSEKIKMAMTGDKEWRKLLIIDSNKLVSSAVLKNPRITDGEVLGVASNKSSNDELIRLILLNREWMKKYEIKKAIVMHMRTPLPKALRLLSTLAERDIIKLSKSRSVSRIISTSAQKLVELKKQKEGT